ncbi:hypothetical protein CYY_006136 [Polysphondylium violaceum]|uniref:Tetratricopeptide-like helical domain-containing protein n=1 Tax=Polysphondylium violaceum TaxID=133409 RepID=A0A8J4PSS5_9MYCE|nr:hypothetical protein CYY_006136 [Polysphondylium violaceum]
MTVTNHISKAFDKSGIRNTVYDLISQQAYGTVNGKKLTYETNQSRLEHDFKTGVREQFAIGGEFPTCSKGKVTNIDLYPIDFEKALPLTQLNNFDFKIPDQPICFQDKTNIVYIGPSKDLKKKLEIYYFKFFTKSYTIASQYQKFMSETNWQCKGLDQKDVKSNAFFITKSKNVKKIKDSDFHHITFSFNYNTLGGRSSTVSIFRNNNTRALLSSCTATIDHSKKSINTHVNNNNNNNNINHHKSSQSLFYNSISLNSNFSIRTFISSNNNNNNNNSNNEQQIDTKYQSYIDNAIDNFKLKQIDLTLEFIDRAIKLCPNRADAYLLRADINHNLLLEEKNSSINDYKKALQLLSSSAPNISLSILFSMLELSDTPNEIKEYIDKIKLIDPFNKKIMTDYNDDKDRKLAYAKDLFEKGDNYGTFLLASIAKEMEDYSKAEPLFKQVIELEKQRLDTMLIREPQLIHNRFIVDEIVEDDGTVYKRIIEYDGTEEKKTLFLAYSGLGSIYVTLDRLIDAFDNFIAAQQLEPNLSVFSFIFSRLLFQTGHYEEAYAYLEQSLKSDQIFAGKTADYKRSLKADILIALGDYQHAVFELLTVFFGLLKKETDSKEESQRLTKLMSLMLQLFSKLFSLSPATAAPEIKALVDPFLIKHDPGSLLATPPQSMTDMYNQSEILNSVYNDLFYESGIIHNSSVSPQTLASIRTRAHFFDYLYYSLRDSSALVLFKNPLLTIEEFEKSLDHLSPQRKEVHHEQFKVYKNLFPKLF